MIRVGWKTKWIFFSIIAWVWAGSAVGAGEPDRQLKLAFGADGDAIENRAGTCPQIPNSSCLSLFGSLDLVLYDCESGTLGGFPPVHINVPPGDNFRFSVLGPIENFTRFAIVSEIIG